MKVSVIVFLSLISLISYNKNDEILNSQLLKVKVDSSLTEFHWKGISNYKAKLLVPKNYKETDEYYGEGIFTTLSYEDSSYIFLHIGLCVQLPFMQDDIILKDSLQTEKGIIRKGLLTDKKHYWREDNFNGRLINIFYSNIPEKKLEEFEKALNSFQIIEK